MKTLVILKKINDLENQTLRIMFANQLIFNKRDKLEIFSEVVDYLEIEEKENS